MIALRRMAFGPFESLYSVSDIMVHCGGAESRVYSKHL